MTLSDLASIATVISSLAVLASLVYLAQQTRQNTRHTRALIQQGRNQYVMSTALAPVTDPALNDLLLRGDAGDPSLTPAQAVAYLSFVSAQLSTLEDAFYQHKDGLIDDDRHAGTTTFLKDVRATRPGFRAAWLMCRDLWGAEFRTFLDAKVREGAKFPPSDAGGQWLSLAAKERQKQGDAPQSAP